MQFAFRLLVAGGLLLPLAHASDLLVDDDGGAGVYRNVNQAMAVAQPGDRILVMPGSYPPFQFEVGVWVHGLGDEPSDVRIERIDYHVSWPTIGYDTGITNMAVGTEGGLGSGTAMAGNELPPGTLVVDGVIFTGGVFLEGGPGGFYALVSNSDVRPEPGTGFLGAAVTVGRPNNWFEFVDTRIHGWDAVPADGIAAGTALRVEGGTHLRIVGSEVIGGDGAEGPVLIQTGGNGLDTGFFPGPVDLRIDGMSLVAGGDGHGGPGGHGVDVGGSIELGTGGALGGAGTPVGLGWADSLPSALPVGTHLRTLPPLTFTGQGAGLQSGDVLTLEIAEPNAPTAMNLAFSVDVPSNAIFYGLNPFAPILVIGNHVELTIPTYIQDVPGLMVFIQGFVLAPGGEVLLTNADTVRIDLTTMQP